MNMSLLSVCASIIIPSLLNSMFVTTTASVAHKLVIAKYSSLATLEAQNKQMTSNFILSAYSSTWLNQSITEFTTDTYALAPFADLDDFNDGPLKQAQISNGLITSASMRYWAELSCWSPASITLNLTSNTASFDDGRGCYAKDMLTFNSSITNLYPTTSRYEAYVFGPASEGYDPFLSGLRAQCPNHPQLFLMTFREAGASMPDFNANGNATAMFCEPQYYVEPVMATVRAADLSVVDYASMGDARGALSGQDFNISRFEYILSRGVPPTQGTMANLTGGRTLNPILDLSNLLYIRQDRHIQNMSIITPNQASTDLLVGFALGVTQLAPASYLNFTVLSQAYSRAYQMLFARAVAFNFQTRINSATEESTINASTNTILQSAMISSLEEVVRLNASFTIATEVFLGIATILCMWLVFRLPRRTLNLSRNPDSIAATMRLTRFRKTRELFKDMDMADNASISCLCQGLSFYLNATYGILPCDEAKLSLHIQNDAESRKVSDQDSKIKKPAHVVEMSWIVTVTVLVLLLTMAASSTSVCLIAHKRDGLPLPSNSGLVQQLVLTFAPTFTATLLGLYMSLVCRSYSFLRPMQDLQHGNARAHNTLFVRYTSLPAALLWHSAIRARHYLLASLSVLTLLSNVATVTTAGVFVTRQTSVVVSEQINASFMPNVIYTSEFVRGISSTTSSTNVEATYPMLATFTQDAPLPPWTTTQYALLPQDLSSIPSQWDVAPELLKLDVVGYGASLKCSDLHEPSPNVTKSFDLVRNGTSFQLWANFTLPNDDIKSCGWDHSVNLGQPSLGQLSESPSALELSYFLMAYNASGGFQDSFCQRQIMKGWVRGWLDEQTIDNGLPRVRYNATILLCQAQQFSQQMEVNVTTNGTVLSTIPMGQKMALPQSVNLSAPLNSTLDIYQDTYMLPVWHNASDLVARDTSNELYLSAQGNRDFLNASLPPPSTEVAADVVSKTFGTMFAMQMSVDRSRLKPYNTAASARTHVGTEQVAGIDADTIDVQAFLPVRKVFVSLPNLVISLFIILSDFLALATLRLSLPRPFLPRMPFTIGSQIAYIASSNIVDDVVNGGKDFREHRYAYGRFIGKDGRVHIGIERQAFVHDLHDSVQC